MKKIENNGIVYRRLRSIPFDMRRASDNHSPYDLNHPLLDREQEIDLLKKFKSGNKAEANKAAEALLAHNQRFILEIASRFLSAKSSMADLVQAGNIGLLVAAKRFQLERGLRLMTYAAWYIKKEIRNHLVKCGAYPPRRQKLRSFVSLEDVPESAISENALQEREALLGELWYRVEILPALERQTIKLRFQQELSLRKTGNEIGYSRERVRHFVKDALAILREQLAPED